jgi:hypothetical protein
MDAVMNVNRVSKPHGQIQSPLLSKLPSLVEERYGYGPADQSDFDCECVKRLLEAGLFSREQRRRILFRQHHGRKPVHMMGDSLLFLIADIVAALKNYAREELIWINLDEGETYRCLLDAADRIDPAGRSFYYRPRVEPVRTTKDLRGLAKELRQLAKKNKIHWTPEKRWHAFLQARRNLVACLWAAFDVHTRPTKGHSPSLPDTAIYKWIAKILSKFQIYTKEQQTTNLWKTIRHDRDSRSYQTDHFLLERARREELARSLPHRRQLLASSQSTIKCDSLSNVAPLSSISALPSETA